MCRALKAEERAQRLRQKNGHNDCDRLSTDASPSAWFFFSRRIEDWDIDVSWVGSCLSAGGDSEHGGALRVAMDSQPGTRGERFGHFLSVVLCARAARARERVSEKFSARYHRRTFLHFL
jgi:hypothetical protein